MQCPAGKRMDKSDCFRMQALPAAVKGRFFGAVYRVPGHRVADVGKMHPDLMGPAGFEGAAQPGKTRKFFEKLNVRYGIFGIFWGNAHFFAVIWVSSNRCIYCKVFLLYMAMNNSFIGSLEIMHLDLLRQRTVCRIVFGHN